LFRVLCGNVGLKLMMVAEDVPSLYVCLAPSQVELSEVQQMYSCWKVGIVQVSIYLAQF